MVLVKYYGVLITTTDCNEEQFEARNIKELLKAIREKYGEEIYKQAKMSYILVNGVSASNLNGYQTKLKADDAVQFLPVCGGG